MANQFIFNFKKDISEVKIPENLNNPFAITISEIAKIAVKEFQEFISSNSHKWGYDFQNLKGKMFGILVIKNVDKSLSYIGTVSGKLSRNTSCKNFIPSVFNDSIDPYFLDRGMTELSEIGEQIKLSKIQSEVTQYTEFRKQKSFDLQQKLFENYKFSNVLGKKENVIQIFENSSHGYPPSAAGECAAPKLLQFAFENQLKPISIAEFWWGNPPKNKERKHKAFYPACKNKCRPILEYMLDDMQLFKQASEN